MLSAFLRFSRPHTIIGTSLSILALYLMALAYAEGGWESLDTLLLTLLSCLGANIYIVGLNQLTDVEIDRINKPYLPLASGEFSRRTAIIIISASVGFSLAIAFRLGNYLLWTVLLSLFLGTIYSLPPIRLKRFYFWAAFCIIAVRSLLVNLLLFLHFHSIINGSHRIPPAVWLLTAVIFVYSIVIAWFKDLPDRRGDREYRIRTLTLALGAERVYRYGNSLLFTTFALLLVVPANVAPALSAPLMAGAHILFGVLLWQAGRKVDFEQPESLFAYYQFIWKLFFLEYIVFVLAMWV